MSSLARKGSFGEVTCSSDRCWPIDTTFGGFVDESATDVDLRWLYYGSDEGHALDATESSRQLYQATESKPQRLSLIALLLPPS